MKIKRFWNIQSSDSMSWLVWFINDFSFEKRAGGGGGGGYVILKFCPPPPFGSSPLGL